MTSFVRGLVHKLQDSAGKIQVPDEAHIFWESWADIEDSKGICIVIDAISTVSHMNSERTISVCD